MSAVKSTAIVIGLGPILSDCVDRVDRHGTRCIDCRTNPVTSSRIETHCVLKHAQ